MAFGWELVVWHTRPSMFCNFPVQAWRECGGLNKEKMLYWFDEGQIRSDMSRCAEMSLALNELKCVGCH